MTVTPVVVLGLEDQVVEVACVCASTEASGSSISTIDGRRGDNRQVGGRVLYS